VSSERADFHEESSGTLPWATSTERTIAAGMAIVLASPHGAPFAELLFRPIEDLQSSWLSGLLELW